jgi:excisionase family DNA binding protein
MSSATVVDKQQTVLPDQVGEVIDLLAVLRAKGKDVPQRRARLVGADGSEVELPDQLHAALTRVVDALARGLAVTIAPQHTTLTTQQAADMLGVSRPTLIKLLDEGKIPYDKPNSHRRIKLSDLLAYQDRRREERRATLRDLTQEAVEADFYALSPSEFLDDRPK